MTTEKDLRSEAREILRTTRVLRRGAQSEQISLFGAILLAQAERALPGIGPSCRNLVDQSGSGRLQRLRSEQAPRTAQSRLARGHAAAE